MQFVYTTTFVERATAYDSFALGPGYWDFLVRLVDSCHAVSIKSVYDELDGASDDDPLKAWAKLNKQHFVAPDSRVVSCYQQVSAWAMRSHEQRAVNEFLRVADSWIVAHALAYGWVVVTHEKSAPASKRRIKIPDACSEFGVECLNPFKMLEREGMRLTL